MTSDTKTIYGTTQLFHALRTIIPNLPADHVESLVLKIGPIDSVPTVSVVMACVGPDGEYRLNEDQTDVVRETKRFKVIPDDVIEAPAEAVVESAAA